ncbi:MAG: efflux RND transporter periplasmic adaptor subunit [Burkholderiales bacterium]|nr:efflux RND transporter periplasmic adaptor subunit [Burkholderiales bacterium]
MKTRLQIVVIGLLLFVVAALGFWAGQRRNVEPKVSTSASAPQTKEKKLLFYRNPMGLPDTSPTPKKDPMGMDYIAVYEGEESDVADENEVKISSAKVQKLGVRSEAAQLRELDQTLRAMGRIEVDERKVVAIAPKFDGYIDALHVNAVGQVVSKGQTLFEAYSPELISAQREYAIAMQGLAALKDADANAQRGMQQLADASLLRLKNWDVSEAQITALQKSGESRRSLSFRSPVAGVVTEKKALKGMRFMSGETLYQITDLSSVWLMADVPEQDIALLRTGAKASVSLTAYPGQTFSGKVSFIYPSLNPQTRTVPVRIELANPQALLKPAMFAQVELPVSAKGKVLTIPHSAVIDSGVRQLVLLVRGEGRFEPREVKLGARSRQWVEVTGGLNEGDVVVTAANFLIDAESNLKAAVAGFTSADHAQKN